MATNDIYNACGGNTPQACMLMSVKSTRYPSVTVLNDSSNDSFNDSLTWTGGSASDWWLTCAQALRHRLLYIFGFCFWHCRVGDEHAAATHPDVLGFTSAMTLGRRLHSPKSEPRGSPGEACIALLPYVTAVPRCHAVQYAQRADGADSAMPHAQHGLGAMAFNVQLPAAYASAYSSALMGTAICRSLHAHPHGTW